MPTGRRGMDILGGGPLGDEPGPVPGASRVGRGGRGDSRGNGKGESAGFPMFAGGRTGGAEEDDAEGGSGRAFVGGGGGGSRRLLSGEWVGVCATMGEAAVAAGGGGRGRGLLFLLFRPGTAGNSLEKRDVPLLGS